MNQSAGSRAKGLVNSALGRADLMLVRKSTQFSEFIPLDATLRDAKSAGLSVGDFIDLKYNVPGATQDTIDHMYELGVFEHPTDRICEIGPGSGRYLEKVIRQAQPKYYEIYETSRDWSDYLARTYGVVALESNGKTLAETPSDSINLLHSHKVFEGLPIFTTFRYFSEIDRVVQKDGKVVFDIITENCLDDETIGRWLQIWDPYAKSMVLKQHAVDYFTRRGFRFDGSFIIPMLPGSTEYLVFTRTKR